MSSLFSDTSQGTGIEDIVWLQHCREKNFEVAPNAIKRSHCGVDILYPSSIDEGRKRPGGRFKGWKFQITLRLHEMGHFAVLQSLYANVAAGGNDTPAVNRLVLLPEPGLV